MKKKPDPIPVYDLCTINPNLLHHDISTGLIANYYPFRNKLIIPHRHTYYHIFLFTCGGGAVTIDFEHYQLHPGRIYFMIPGQVHTWDVITPETNGYVFNFSENIFRTFITTPDYLYQFPFLRGIPSDSVIDLEGNALKEVTHFFKQLLHEAGKEDSFSMEQICFHLMSLFISVSRHEKIPAQKNKPLLGQKILSAYRKLIDDHYKETTLPKDYAAMLYITPHRLNALCNDLLGMSAGALIRNRIILEAKRLLVNVDMSITEIAYELNFSDNSYFSKFFKKYAAVTPEEFRKSHSL